MPELPGTVDRARLAFERVVVRALPRHSAEERADIVAHLVGALIAALVAVWGHLRSLGAL